ncbi:MAG: hypothetical protein IPL64_08460 [Flavobacteriales bacterium]|nr:hypothetical protein [Flavobacteriales bacterium]
MPQSKVEALSDGSGKWLKAGRAFGGGMKLWRGHMQRNYFLGVYTGMDFIEEESVKPKAGDIWRITPGGFKSLSDIDAMATDNGFYNDVQKFGNPLLMPANATMLAAGVITEKVKLSTDQEFAANRVAVLSVSGSDIENIPYDIYLLPHGADHHFRLGPRWGPVFVVRPTQWTNDHILIEAPLVEGQRRTTSP